MPPTDKHDEAKHHRPAGTKECSDTGMAMAMICLIAGWFSHDRRWLLAAIALLAATMTWPGLFRFPARLWFGFSHALGTIMSKSILATVFFVILTPLALVRRAIGHDLMRLGAWKRGKNSVFEVRDHTYTPVDIERPF